MKFITGTKGEGYIDSVVSILVAMMMIVLSINVFSLLTVRQNMDFFAKEMLAAATATGSTAGETAARYEELAEETGLRPDCSWEAEYFNAAEGQVQLGDTMKIRLVHHTDLKGFGMLQIPVTLSVACSGISEKYWKQGT
jgi:hypothetical protein